MKKKSKRVKNEKNIDNNNDDSRQLEKFPPEKNNSCNC